MMAGVPIVVWREDFEDLIMLEAEYSIKMKKRISHAEYLHHLIQKEKKG